MPAASAAAGVVLLTMGGPRDAAEIETFLRGLFSDPLVLQLPGGRFYQDALAKWLARRRAPKVAGAYRRIGYSPLCAQTERQARALESALGCPATVAFRYVPPDARGAVAELQRRGVRQVVGLPMYPQFSRTTAESSLAELERVAGEAGLACSRVCAYPENEGFISAIAETFLGVWDKAGLPENETAVLATAHGLPEQYTKRGDPYISQVQKTFTALCRRLPQGLRTSLAYQSRVGPLKWHGPAPEEEAARLAGRGARRLVVIPISFVAEHFETLYELDVLLAERARALGFATYQRIPTVIDHPLFIEGLAGLVREALAGDERKAAHG